MQLQHFNGKYYKPIIKSHVFVIMLSSKALKENVNCVEIKLNHILFIYCFFYITAKVKHN